MKARVVSKFLMLLSFVFMASNAAYASDLYAHTSTGSLPPTGDYGSPLGGWSIIDTYNTQYVYSCEHEGSVYQLFYSVDDYWYITDVSITSAEESVADPEIGANALHWRAINQYDVENVTFVPFTADDGECTPDTGHLYFDQNE